MLICERIIGIDLGVSTSHNACVIDIATGKVIGRRKFVSKPSDLIELVEITRRGLDSAATIGVVMEATAGAWYAPAAWFAQHHIAVYRVSTSKAADLRKFFSRHVKTNTIDAETLARLGLLAPDSLEPLEFGDSHRAGLDRRCRASHRYTVQSTNHLIRIRQLLYHLMPRFNLAVTGAFAMSDLALLERWANPHLLAAVPRKRLVAFIRKASTGHVNSETRADLWLQAAREAVELFGDETGIAFDDVAAEIASEIRMWRACQTELAAHEQSREKHYNIVDPEGLARSLPGIKEAGGPVIVAALGRAHRFPTAAQFKNYSGLAPKASETGNTDRKGQVMSKAGPRLLRHQLVMSANTARQMDPQLAKVYYDQMTSHGAHHTKAVCVVAAKLAERAWTVMTRGTRYVICDIDGTPVDNPTARAIIADRYHVPPEIRQRRRSKQSNRENQAVERTSDQSEEEAPSPGTCERTCTSRVKRQPTRRTSPSPTQASQPNTPTVNTQTPFRRATTSRPRTAQPLPHQPAPGNRLTRLRSIRLHIGTLPMEAPYPANESNSAN